MLGEWRPVPFGERLHVRARPLLTNRRFVRKKVLQISSPSGNDLYATALQNTFQTFFLSQFCSLRFVKTDAFTTFLEKRAELLETKK